MRTRSERSVSLLSEVRGLRLELVCWLSIQEWTWRIVHVATGATLRAEQGEWYWTTIRDGRLALARILFKESRP